MSGATYWWMKDGSWYTRDEVRRVARKFGAVGPGVMDWLYCAAKRENRGGRFKAGAFTIADELGEEEVTVRNVVSHLVTRSWLVGFEEDGDTFKAKIDWYEADQRRGLAAERQARFRDKQKESDDPVTDRNALSQDETRRGEVKERAKALSSAQTEIEKATPEDRALCRLFYELGRHRNPKLKIPGKNTPAQAEALKAMRLLRDRDAQTHSDIEQLIRWVFTDPSEDAVFWGTTIQAPSGLRKNFTAAWAKMHAAASRPGTVESVDDLVAYAEARKARTAA